MENKIYKQLSKYKKLKKKIVLCHGVFDLLHIGHVTYFEQAKKLGDILVISVTDDKYVNKGPLRPVFKINQRIAFLKKLKIVDIVLKSDFETAEKIIESVKPDIYCKGPDYKNKKKIDINLKKEIYVVKKYKGKFVTVEHNTQSSSQIINEANLDLNKDDLSRYLGKIRSKYSYSHLISEIKKIQNVKSLVLGEMIIDKYNFADSVGRSGKDPMMVYRLKEEKSFLGGSGYIANLSSSLAGSTNHIFHVGVKNSQASFIKKMLSKNIKYEMLTKSNSPTIKKLRYVDFYRNNKIIGFYDINEEPLSEKEENLYIKKISEYKNKVDLIILADYGHGEISNSTIQYLQKNHKKIFINTQLNSFNFGSHNLKKFKKVNTLCVNEGELRFELRDKKSNINNLVMRYKKSFNCENLVVTQGKFGATIFSKNNQKFFCPAFDVKPIDTIGSGDTLFTVLSLCLASGINPELSLLFSSIAAAMSTQNMGNDFNLNNSNLEKNLKSLFIKQN